MGIFKLHAPYRPAGDQPEAIRKLAAGFKAHAPAQTLLGVTGSGKTFTLAAAITELDRPVLVLSHNKTLAAQLYSEFKSFFPENAVEYFVSYYDYYMPESYIPQTDTYIAKDSAINAEIERLRLSAVTSLIERRDVIVVASVSCIYSLGAPEEFTQMCIRFGVHEQMSRQELLAKLVDIQYARNDLAPERGQFRVRGDAVDVFEPQRDDFVRISFWGDEVESIERRDPVSGKLLHRPEVVTLFPCKQFVLPPDRIERASERIRRDMEERVRFFEQQQLLVEAQRLYQRVTYDLEMMKELGYCSGIENYSWYLTERPKNSRPYCLFDFFPDDLVTVIDESHVTLPQLQAMYKADRHRKEVLIEHGFRLPAALENRPLQFEEFQECTPETVYVSATPGDYELSRSGEVIELVVRPTGLLDPPVEIRPQGNQVDDVIAEIRAAAAKGERVMVTTLTKKSSERLSDYLKELGIRACYLHSDLDALERVRILNHLRDGAYDCLIGINLLREGIDLPEVALVAILDADKVGFLRSERSLVQTAGRAARNRNGRVILYADEITPSIKGLLELTERRRRKQLAYNEEHHIVPETIHKEKKATISEIIAAGKKTSREAKRKKFSDPAWELDDTFDFDAMELPADETQALITELTREMLSAADALEFERAAALRDRIRSLQKKTEK